MTAPASDLEAGYRTDLLAAAAAAATAHDHGVDPADVEAMTMWLYGAWYARAGATPTPPPGFPDRLVEVLRAADATAQRWSDGWTVNRVAGNGQLIAQRDGAVRLVDRCDAVVPGRLGVLPRAGDRALIAGRHDHVDGDGWWRASGTGWRFTKAGNVPLVRLYWNVGLGAVPTVVRGVTARLAGESRPWMLKCATDPAAHVRADAVVLFLTPESVSDHAPTLTRIAERLADDALPGAPPLALPVQRGLAVAVDPVTAESFGEHRCRLIAEALTGRAAANRPDDAAVLGAIGERFAREGIEVGRPYAMRATASLPWEEPSWTC